MRLTFDMELPELLYRELLEACTERSCHRTTLASEALECLLAARRLPKVYVPELTQGARMRGVTAKAAEDQEQDFEDAAEAGLVTHGILLPEVERNY